MRVLQINKYFSIIFLLICANLHADESRVLDLSAHTLEQGQQIEIAENWQFYWEKYLFPDDALEGGQAVGESLPWTTIPNKENGHPAHGFGTYAITIKLPQRSSTELAFKLRRIKTAYAVYVEGNLVGHSNNISNYPVELDSSPNISGVVTFNVPLDKPEISVLIHVSSMKYYRGGMDQPPQLSYAETAYTSRMKDILWAAFIAGALLFMGIYHFGLWLKRRSNLTSLYFSILAVAVGVRSFFTYKLAYLIYPNLTEDTMLWCETVLAYTALPFLHIFISSSFPKDANKYITGLSWFTWMAMMIVSCGTSLYTMSSALPPFEIYFIIILFHMIYLGVITILNKREGAILFSFGFVIALITGILDVLFYNGTYLGLGRPIFPFGILFFVFIQFVLHSMRFSSAYRELQALSNTLELQIDERTKELSMAHEESKKAHEETRLLSNAITNILEEERKSIARELHDDFGQSIRGAGLYAETISRKLAHIDSENQDIKKCIEISKSIESELKEVYQKNRNLLRRLRPEIIDTLGLESAIEELLDNYRRNDYKITFNCDADVTKLDNKEKITIYRILQESITNILKYAEIRSFDVSLKDIENDFIFCVSDEGKGFDMTAARGIGLISMRERMTDIGGTIEIQSAKGKGTKITAKFPKNKSL